MDTWFSVVIFNTLNGNDTILTLAHTQKMPLPCNRDESDVMHDQLQANVCRCAPDI